MLFHPEVMTVEMLAQKIRKIPNWPQEGVLFHDITPVLQSPEYFRLLVDLFTYHYMGQKLTWWQAWKHVDSLSARRWRIN